ncbi:MAG: exopolysaccharide biosynthesis protein [Pseudomonadota bacterium]
MSNEHVVDDVFNTVEETASGADQVSVGDLISTFGNRVYGPVIFVVGLLAFSPLGAIPGASILFATLIILLAVQYAVAGGEPWLPEALRKREVSGERATKAMEKTRPYAKKVEFLFSERAVHLASAPWTWLWAAVMVVLAVTMYPLALVPGGVAAPALALAIMGLAMTARDGIALAIAAGLGVAACALTAAFFL